MYYLTEILKEQYPQYPHLANAVYRCFPRDLKLNEVTPVSLSKLARWLKANLAANTAKAYAAYIKAALRVYADEGVGTKDFTVLNIKGQASVQTWLDEDELHLLEDYLPKVSGQRRMYLLLFLISSYTGCRSSDVIHLSESNISKGKLTYVCQKTGIKAQVFAKSNLGAWINSAKMLMEQYNYSKRLYSRHIKNICREVGITDITTVFIGGKEMTDEKWKFVSTHTARRSFATCLYQRGLDITSIAKMMGHSDVEMTMGYICCGLREIDDSVKGFFN